MFPSMMSSLKCCSICYAEAAAGDVLGAMFGDELLKDKLEQSDIVLITYKYLALQKQHINPLALEHISH